jgi:hypothetical protein
MEAVHDMLIMKLDCGRQVSLDAFNYGRTYGGLMLGRPNAKLNAWTIEAEVAAASKSWGPRKTHLIPPAVDDRDPKHPLLPPTCLWAWLTCPCPIKPTFQASELVVVWFADECHAEPIADVVFRAVRGLPWEELAQDFNY